VLRPGTFAQFGEFNQRGRLGGDVARLLRMLTRGLENRGSRQDRRQVRAISHDFRPVPLRSPRTTV
jgi:hypothetical protein